MKVAVSAMGNTLQEPVDPRFGRCAQFLIINTNDHSFKRLPNPAVSEGHGAGIVAAQTVINQGVEAVISGNFGPNAYRTLTAANIKLYQGSGPIIENIKKLEANQLAMIKSPGAAHVGLGRGAGRGGGGRGGGGRGGGGRGRRNY